MSRPPIPNTPITTAALVITGSLLFCSKGIIVKLLYAEGITPSGVLALRMISSLPFFILMIAQLGRGAFSVQLKDWGLMAALSFVGYFLCSLVNFTGLQHISVGLERVILFSYPTLVLAGSVIFQGARHSIKMYAACALSWVGLYVLIREEISFAGDFHWVVVGSAMVLASAIIYAGYIIIAKPVIQRVGVQRYTGISMSFSCIFVLTYFSLSNGDFGSLFASPKVITYGAVIGIFGTVIPTFLLSYGLSKISSSSYAVISSIGPVITIVLAALFVGDSVGIPQFIGMACSIAGGLLAALKGSKIKQPA